MSDHAYGPHSNDAAVCREMTRAELIAKYGPYSEGVAPKPDHVLLYTQAQLDAMVAAERERCAKIADRAHTVVLDLLPARTAAAMTGRAIAEAIRSGE